MIFMPPRHGKSEIGSVQFPAWLMGRDKDRNVIEASYSGDLATDFGRQVRNLVRSKEYQNIFEGRNEPFFVFPVSEPRYFKSLHFRRRKIGNVDVQNRIRVDPSRGSLHRFNGELAGHFKGERMMIVNRNRN
jgi:hypothetical protein